MDSIDKVFASPSYTNRGGFYQDFGGSDNLIMMPPVEMEPEEGCCTQGMEKGVPLVIPEVNPEAMDGIEVGKKKGALIANPSCSTIICLMAATPLHRRAKVTRMVVSTYQAASGAGAAAMHELELQTREVLEEKPPTCNFFKQQYAFNLFSHNAPVLENGYKEEELKMVKKIENLNKSRHKPTNPLSH